MKLPLVLIPIALPQGVKPLDDSPLKQALDLSVLDAAEAKLVSGFQTPAAADDATTPPAAAVPAAAPSHDWTMLDRPKRIAIGMASLAKLEHFMPKSQRQAVQDSIARSEERDYFIGVMIQLASMSMDMPTTYDTRDEGDPMVWLHYFWGGYDCWIIETDKGDKPRLKDSALGAQHQAFGYVRFANMPECAECGYVSLPELFKAMPMVNLDFGFTPCRLSELKAQLDPPEDEDEFAP